MAEIATGGAEDHESDAMGSNTPKEASDAKAAESSSVSGGNGKTTNKATNDVRPGRIAGMSEGADYSRMGFYRAIGSNGDAPTALQELLHEVHSYFSKRLSQSEAVRLKEEECLKGRIDAIDKEILERERELIEYKDSRDGLQKESVDAIARLQALRRRIYEEFAKLSERREEATADALQRRLTEVDSELDHIIEQRLKLARKRHDVSSMNFEKAADTFAQKVNRFKKTKELTDSALEVVSRRIRNLIAYGLTAGSARFLVVSGLVGVVATGWFFSVYIVQNVQLQNTDHIAYILRRLFAFAAQVYVESGDQPWIAFFTFIAGWIGLLALIVIVTWACQWLIDHKVGKTVESASVELDEEDRVLLRVSAAPEIKPFVGNWLRVIPFALVVGLFFGLIAFVGADSAESADLTAFLGTLSGEFVGALIALVVSGLAILYITMIVEPRLTVENPTKWQIAKQHWEIGLLLVLLFTWVIAGGVYALATGQTIPPYVSNLWIMLLTLYFTAFALGYGSVIYGLLFERQQLQNQSRALGLAIEDNMRPRPLDVSVIEGKTLQRKLDDSVDDLMDISRLKNDAVKEVYRDYCITVEPEKAGTVKSVLLRFGPWVKRVLLISKKDGESDIDVGLPEPTPSDMRLQPELSMTILELRDEWRQERAAYDRLLMRIREISSFDSEHETKLRQALSELRKSKESLERSLVETLSQHSRIEESIWRETTDALTKTRGGFELGTWYGRVCKAHSSGVGAARQTGGSNG